MMPAACFGQAWAFGGKFPSGGNGCVALYIVDGLACMGRCLFFIDWLDDRYPGRVWQFAYTPFSVHLVLSMVSLGILFSHYRQESTTRLAPLLRILDLLP